MNMRRKSSLLLFLVISDFVASISGNASVAGASATDLKRENAVLESNNAADDAGRNNQQETNGTTTTKTTTSSREYSQSPKMLTTAEHGQRQIEWVRSLGGFVHSGFEIRRADPADPESRYGVFAATDISKSELILSIPRHCLIQPPPEDEDADTCTTMEILAREMALGEKSLYEPYVTYLKTQMDYGQIPSLWSTAAQVFLTEQILLTDADDDEEEESPLPPNNPIDAGFCDPEAELERKAHMLIVQRSWDEMLIPVWDMVSHRNGAQWTNVQEEYSVFDTDYPVRVIAMRNIRAGEELFMSYDHCPDCGGRARNYGTPEIFRDYGFVELFPQKFVFQRQGVSFTIDEEEGNNSGMDDLLTDDHGKRFKLQWHTPRPKGRKLEFFHEQIDRLSKLDMTYQPNDIPRHEWQAIVQFHAAMTRAMKLLVRDTQNFVQKMQRNQPNMITTGVDHNGERTTTTSTTDWDILLQHCRADLERNEKRLQNAIASSKQLMEEAKEYHRKAEALYDQLLDDWDDMMKEKQAAAALAAA